MGNQDPRWSAASDVIPMFPTLVWKIELEAQLREAIDARVFAALARLRREVEPTPAETLARFLPAWHGIG